MYVEVNPDNDQPEQYHFNNFFYKDILCSSGYFEPVNGCNL